MSNENSSNEPTINQGTGGLRDSLRMRRHPRDKRRQKHGEVVTAFDVKGLSELTETCGEIEQSVFQMSQQSIGER